MSPRTFLALAAGSLLGSTLTLMVTDEAAGQRDTTVDVPFTLHFPDPDAPGDLRVERWLCDVDVDHADCTEPAPMRAGETTPPVAYEPEEP